MFTPEIAKKANAVLDSHIESTLIMLFDDLINQRINKIKANAPDLELRISAAEIELLQKLKKYKSVLEDAVKRHVNSQ